MGIDNYHKQYDNARSNVLNAMNNKQNIVLWGSGCNGKTHLVNEILNNDESIRTKYDMLIEGCAIEESNKKFLIECVDMHYILTDLKDHSFVFINMNEYKYPKYTKLRSGRACPGRRCRRCRCRGRA
jgi:hypothetical protein